MQFGREACHELNHSMVSISISFSIRNDSSNMVAPFNYDLYSYLYPRHQIYQLKKIDDCDFIKTMSAIPSLDKEKKKITNINQFNLVISSLIAGTIKSLLHFSTKCTIPHESHTSSWYHYIEYNQMLIMCVVEQFVNKNRTFSSKSKLIVVNLYQNYCFQLFLSFLHRTSIWHV